MQALSEKKKYLKKQEKAVQRQIDEKDKLYGEMKVKKKVWKERRRCSPRRQLIIKECLKTAKAARTAEKARKAAIVE